ncbi:MAG: MBL fold metallo-hydrolase [Lachnospiraceae bacterium]|jgi:glyoxylase-like metal-dependent hydrolase (beta-lactamase superfamily II)|nr:MBL fold metallo-hydrolase [Lachnospiraceae bacterium]
MQILPDIYLLSGYAFGLHQNVYGIDIPDKKQLILIDCGLDKTDRHMIKRSKALWNLEDRKTAAVFITHSHFDHAGNAAGFEAGGSRIYAGKDSESLLSGDEHTIDFAYGKPFPVCRRVHTLYDKDRITLGANCEIICHHTPGHTPGSMCYELNYTGMKIIFTGDFIQAGESVNAVRLGIKVDIGYNYVDYLDSMRKMMCLNADAVLPGHYYPWLSNGKRMFQLGYRELLVNREHYV